MANPCTPHRWLLVASGILLMALGGCTFHPKGEHEERAAATQAATPYDKQWEDRDVPPLAADASLDQIVQHALLANAELEQHYWEWRSAIEQIPQDGTQPTNLAIFGASSLMHGSPAWDRTTLAAGNDPMADIVWPDKLSTAARRALENARAAGWRFQKAKFELRKKVLSAYYDYALTAELIRLEQTNAQLLQTTVMASEARNRTGMGAQQDLFKTRNELDLSRNDIAAIRAQLPNQRATLNTLLCRDPAAAINVPVALPVSQKITQTDEQLLTLATQHNPELLALSREIEGRKESIHLANLQYYPDFSISVGTDLSGVAQSLAGMVTVPLLRHEAIDAAIRQAEANLRAAEATRRQAGNDLRAQIIMDLAMIREADRQIDLYDKIVLPRARQSITVTRSAYESGQVPLPDLLGGQRSLLAVQRLVAQLHVAHEKSVADIDAITTRTLER